MWILFSKQNHCEIKQRRKHQNTPKKSVLPLQVVSTEFESHLSDTCVSLAYHFPKVLTIRSPLHSLQP
jgi:hypothetical protein